MFPKLISIGNFFLPTYGFLVALGFLAGLWQTRRIAVKAKLDPELISNLAVYSALAGLAGAKLFMFLFDFGYYASHPGELFSLGTLLSAGVFHGGFLVGLGFAVWYMQKNSMPILTTLDVFAPGLALGHAIGRSGCFAAGCCWGKACDRAWAVTFTNPDAHTLVGVPLGVPLHPTQIYESLLTFGVYLLLLMQSRRKVVTGTGRMFGIYLIAYSVVRIVSEFYREHDQGTPVFNILTWTQTISVILLYFGILLVRYRTRRTLA